MKEQLRRFIHSEIAGGILLGLAALTALMLNNSPLENLYDGFLTIPVAIQIGEFSIDKPLLLWINDGLMAVFFLMVGLEIKREILEGQLSSFERISLPAVAAFGGIAVPALIYSYINWHDDITIHGWAIPAATDIAFALGVLSLLGNRVPDALKVCLVAIAILDDLAAIVIIALFYTEHLSLLSLGIGAVAVVVLAIMNRRNVLSLSPYVVVGIILWACVLKSGVHATLAGVVLAMFIPLRPKNAPDNYSPANAMEGHLHPWVVFAILPIFAFANAGVSLYGLTFEVLMHPVTLGIAAGLFFGKQIGIMLMTYLGVACKFCKLPVGINWKQYYGMALITGVGFTMSLFIGTLAFDSIEYQRAVRLGVMIGSCASGLLGFIVLRLASKPVVQ